MRPLRHLFDRSDLWGRGFLVAFLCAGIAVLATSELPHARLTEALSESREIIQKYPTAGALLFVFCAALSAMVAFVSVAVIVPIAVYTWGAPTSMALLWVGWIAGGVLSYAAGSSFGRPILKWIVSEATLGKFESRVHRDLPFGSVLILQLALPSEIPGYLLGTVRYPFRKFMLALAIAELPYTAATIYLSEGLVQSRSSFILIVGAFLVVLSIGAAHLLRRTESKENGHQK